MSERVAFKASYLLGQVHVRIALALELDTNSDTYDAIKRLKEDLDYQIGQLYYSNSASSET